MKQRLLTILLTLLSITASADDSGSCGDNVFFSYTESTHILRIYGNGPMMEYIYEETINGTTYVMNRRRPWENYIEDIQLVEIENGVTNIGGRAFSGCKALSSISLPESVTSIGREAFYYCSNLTSITIPNSLTSIEQYAFAHCSRLTSVTIGNNVTSIGYEAFRGCDALTSVIISDVAAWCNINFAGYDSNPLSIAHHLYLNNEEITDLVIPNNVTSISDIAFNSCRALTSVTFPNSLINIGEYAFSGCSALSSITIPDNVASIGNRAFNGCSNLISLSIGKGVTSIGKDVFLNCNALSKVNISDIAAWCNIIFADYTSNPLSIAHHLHLNNEEITDLVIPNNVTTISDRTFYGCSFLTSVTISNSVTIIGEYAFSGCSALNSVVIGNNVTSINSYAFDGCSTLSSLTIPNSVTSIGDRSFSSCLGLTSLTIGNNVKTIGSSAFSSCKNLTSVTIPNSVTTMGDDVFSNCDNLFSLIIPNSVTSMGHWSFEEHKNLASISLPNCITSIHDCAFQGCRNLYSILIPNSVTSIGKNAFRFCSTLPSVNIPEGVKSIGESAFENCNSLTKVSLPSTLVSIGSWAFQNCNSLTSITIPGSMTNIPQQAFDGCSRLTSVILENGVKRIGFGVFYNCGSLASVTIPSSVTQIDEKAFAGCSSLISIEIPKNIQTISNGVFYECSSLNSVTIPNSVTSIGNEAFYKCRNLIIVDIPNSVTSIGEYTFKDCSSLTNVSLPDNLRQIKKQAFAYCSNLTRIIIPASVEIIYQEAYKGCSSLQQINALPTTPPFIYDMTFSNYSVPLIVPNGYIDAYKSAEYWKNFTNITDGTQYFKLTYMVDGEVIKVMDIQYGAAITPEPEPIKEGYTFSGWSEIPETMPDHDVTVTGTFTINKYKLIYKVDDEEYKSYDVEYNSAITAETAPTKEGYTFSGWSEKPETMPAHDVTITGTFTINKYKLIYMVDGEEYKSFEIEYNSAITPEAEPTKDGYKFSGWSEIPETMPAHDVTITGSFERVYSGGDVANLIDLLLFGDMDDDDIALYDMNGDGELNIGDLILIMRAAQNNSRNRSAANRAAENQTIEFATDIVTMKPGETSALNISLSSSISGIYGIQFEVNLPEGFSLEKGSNDKIYEMSANQVDDITCNDRDLGNGTYRFFIYSSTLQELKGGSLMSLNLKADAAQTLGNYSVSISNVVLSDYDGHVTKEDGSSVGVKVTNTFTLLYQVDGEDYKSYEIEYGESITPEAEPTKEGYTFSGWSEIPETMPAEDVIVKGTFTVNQYILTYVVDGEVYKEYSYDYGSAITPEAEPTKEGYTFSGWSEIPETMPAKEVYVVGTFTINKYKITYVIDGEVYLTEEVEYGSWITPPNPDDYEGYDFAWEDYPDTMPAHDITINGTYTATGIEAILASKPDVKIFTVSGKPLNKVQKGVNILRYKDGRTRKIVVK